MFSVELSAIIAYVVLGRVVMQTPQHWRDPLFGLLSLAAVYFFFYWDVETETRLFRGSLFASYFLMVVVQFIVLRLCSTRQGWLPWIAFLIPIIFLLIVRYFRAPELLAFLLPKDHELLQGQAQHPLNAEYIGFSYLAFRTSYLVLEVRNGLVPQPGFWQYIGFAFFLPTLTVGPISPYSQHVRAFTEPGKLDLPLGRAILRIIVGGVKYRFLGPLLNQLTYSGLLLDGHPHLWVDLPVAAVTYYLYLYCNFSGFCDIAIGSAGLMGISVAENFNQPLLARNIKDFWNRWHITLGVYMRDVVFAPVSKSLVRSFGSAHTNIAIAITIMIVFLLVGIWHGVGWNYAVFGLTHGLAVVANHYYTIWLKRRLGKDGFNAYNRNPFIRAVAVTMTFIYITVTLFIFANNGEAMSRIFSMLRFS